MKGWVAEREGEVFAIAQQAGKDVTGLLWAQFQVFAVLRVLFQDAQDLDRYLLDNGAKYKIRQTEGAWERYY